MKFYSKLLTSCTFSRKYRKCAICVCLVAAYFTILRPISGGGFVAKMYLHMEPGEVLQVFTTASIPAKANDTQGKYSSYEAVDSDINRVIFNREFRNITLKPETARSLKSVNRSFAVTIDAPYLIENKALCSTVEQLSVVIMVHTAPKNYDNRMAIRRTWANNSYYSEYGTVRALFFLGRVTNRSLQLEIEREFKEHGDLVQGDFIDSYYNMTLKGVMGYKWLSERCKKAKIILKVDDDVVINMFSFLIKVAPAFLSKHKHMACRRLPRARIERTKTSKWAIGNDIFKGKHSYPPFCQGFMVAISNDVVPELFKSSSVTPFFWIDDVFLYGLVPGNVPGMKYTDLKYGQSVIWGAEKGISCYKRKSCNYLAVLLWTDVAEKMGEIWTLMQKNYMASK